MGKRRLFLTALFLVTMGTGCLQGAGSADMAILGGTPWGSRGTLFGATADADADGYICPGNYNVVPDYDSNLDGTEFWKVCYNNDKKNTIRVNGSTVDSAAVCVYPVEVIDSEHVYVKPDLATGGLVKKCFYASRSDGFYNKPYYDFYDKEVTFEGTSYNAVFIIESRDQAKMDTCLNGPAGPNYNYCPDFSFGRFRQ